jgi:hypothetical protein
MGYRVRIGLAVAALTMSALSLDAEDAGAR